MLRRLKINQFRHVTPGTELTFHDGVNVLLGANAAGKTTLLDLIATVSRGDFATIAEELDIDFEVESEGHLLSASLTLAARFLEDADGGAAGDFRRGLEASVIDAQGELIAWVRFRDGTKTITRNGPEVTSSAATNVWSRALWHVSFEAWPDQPHRPDFEHRDCCRFDESLTLFQGMCGLEPATPRAGLRVVRRNGDVPVVEGRYLPGELAKAFCAECQATELPLVVAIPHARLSFLREAVVQMGFARGDWYAVLLEREPSGDRVVHTYGRFGFGFERADGTYLTERLLSYGQKRLLAFLYYLSATDGPVVADEVVNGLHHAWIAHVMEQLKGRQAFLSTQNPLLLDYLTFETPADVQHTFVFCEPGIEPTGATAMNWHHLTDDDAEAFFDAYQVGIQHVSELLRTRGLW